ncbi:hypothetical protein LJR084_006795 [Variovorax sp. LjRoot84]|uniref:hypothetical protein n=1 Tax=Variovorax sp. LjRoot84 TaxID=3342340 RepID=UPI003ED12B75
MAGRAAARAHSAAPENFAAYLRQYVQLTTHAAYLDALGGSRIAGIAASETNLT